MWMVPNVAAAELNTPVNVESGVRFSATARAIHTKQTKSSCKLYIDKKNYLPAYPLT